MRSSESAQTKIQKEWTAKQARKHADEALLAASRAFMERVQKHHQITEDEAIHIVAKLLPLMPVCPPKTSAPALKEIPPPVDNIPVSKRPEKVSSKGGFDRTAWGQPPNE